MKYLFDTLYPTAYASLTVNGKELRCSRLWRKMSQLGMAKRIGVARSTYVRLSLGDPNVSVGSLLAALCECGYVGNIKRLIANSNEARDEALADMPMRSRARRIAKRGSKQ